MLNSLIFKHYDFAAMEKVRENALISLFRASFYCGKEAKTLKKGQGQAVSTVQMIICHLALLLMRALSNMYDEPKIVFPPRRYGGRPLVKYREPKKAENFGILPIFCGPLCESIEGHFFCYQ